jgi:hypothetical protein
MTHRIQITVCNNSAEDSEYFPPSLEEKGKYDVDVGETKDVPRKEWIAYAYPLQLITVQVQGRRDSLQGDMAQLLR